ncbi:hypothetical protein AVEN_161194-1 [Araneus ventricosus]|uniref:Uncharacterized protein n=1 Tax=Araneus ventricosus TaxID=182803 RepID=A0A4Y2L1I6_ARAVE|nr:hypothetical protein AVEN_161194-1 [Araneus ventricosus]
MVTHLFMNEYGSSTMEIQQTTEEGLPTLDRTRLTGSLDTTLTRFDRHGFLLLEKSNAQLTSFLDSTAGRTPKTFALQGDPSRSRHPPSSKRSPYIVFPAVRDVTWNDLAHSWRIFSPNRDIEKIPASLRSHISSPRWSPRLGVQTWLLSVISYLPL